MHNAKFRWCVPYPKAGGVHSGYLKIQLGFPLGSFFCILSILVTTTSIDSNILPTVPLVGF